ncbi:MAG: hypothetical protein GY703_24185 [Gammaproteobacteria bacterium]|nr:hypothetical protein [Gammaproteobacteria bacterium]
MRTLPETILLTLILILLSGCVSQPVNESKPLVESTGDEPDSAGMSVSETEGKQGSSLSYHQPSGSTGGSGSQTAAAPEVSVGADDSSETARKVVPSSKSEPPAVTQESAVADKATSHSVSTTQVEDASNEEDTPVADTEASMAVSAEGGSTSSHSGTGGQGESDTDAPESIGNEKVAMVIPPPELLSEEAESGMVPSQTLLLDMSNLPMSFSGRWSLDRRVNPVNQKTQCILTSRPVNISDGYDRSDIQLLLTSLSLYVNSDSKLDLSYPETGIQIPGGALHPFSGLAKETVAMFDDDTKMLYDNMTDGGELLVKLGFWPTWPVTETQVARFPLDGFSDAVKALRECERM